MAEGETSCQDLESPNWMYSIIEKLHVLEERPLNASIFKVPNKLRKVDEEAYSPRIVSIGPFHSSTTTMSVRPQTSANKDSPQASSNRDPAKEGDKWQHMLSLPQQTPVKKNDHLLAMEVHKWGYVLCLLNRTRKCDQESKPSSEEILVQCGKAILEMDKCVRGRYAEDIILDPHQLAEIMLVDGCFILELFLRSWLRDFTEEDPIFHNAWMVPTIRHDLALLENQIPFFILEELFDKIIEPLIPKSEHQLITGLALSFFNPDLKLNEESIPKKYIQDGEHLHLLDFLHKFYLPTYHKIDPEGEKYIHPLEALHLSLTSNAAQCTEVLLPQRKESWGFKKSATTLLPQSKESWGFKRSVTKLLEAGIELERGRDDHLLEIRFNKAKGDIIIPPMRIDETTKSLLRNLIAYEQCRGSAQQHITSYAILMKSLIQSREDVELLRERKFITNDLSEVEDVLTFFKSISWGVVPKDCYFVKLSDEVEEYLAGWRGWHELRALRPKWQRYKAEWVRVLFQNPWGMISILALLLTGLQTYYGILAYYPR